MARQVQPISTKQNVEAREDKKNEIILRLTKKTEQCDKVITLQWWFEVEHKIKLLICMPICNDDMCSSNILIDVVLIEQTMLKTYAICL